MIIIDYNGIAISNIITQKLDIDENLIRHMILNSIRMYRTKFKDKFGEVVIAGDAGGNWRYKAFPQYKASRKKGRKDSKMDWNEVASHIVSKISCRFCDSNACSSTFSSFTKYGLYRTSLPVDGTVILYFTDSFNFGNAIIFSN